MRLLCCIAWLLGSPLILLYFWLCMLITTLFQGPRQATIRCRPILDKIQQLADCCAGK
jgi:hypothetical protein